MNTKFKRFNLSKAIIPNSFTAFNALSGFFSIVFASHGEIQTAAILIFVAGIFDAMDGLMARLVGTSSRFGVELDSLSDIVSFGAAPAFLIYQSYFHQYGWAGIVLSSSVLIFGAFRLARFNVQVEDLTQKQDFRGLPIPLSAITVALFSYSFYSAGTITDPHSYFAIPLVVLVSILMISNVKYSKLPSLYTKSVKERILVLALVILGLAFVYLTGGVALFYIFLSVVLFGIFKHIVLMFSKSDDESEEDNIKK